jgi:hypothetical protein
MNETVEDLLAEHHLIVRGNRKQKVLGFLTVLAVVVLLGVHLLK